MPAGLPFVATADGVRIAVRLAPRAAAERVLGLVTEADGRVALKLAVTMAPVDGKANTALLRFLARLCDLPPSSLEIVRGVSDRRKLVAARGDPKVLAAKITRGLRPWIL